MPFTTSFQTFDLLLNALICSHLEKSHLFTWSARHVTSHVSFSNRNMASTCLSFCLLLTYTLQHVFRLQISIALHQELLIFFKRALAQYQLQQIRQLAYHPFFITRSSLPISPYHSSATRAAKCLRPRVQHLPMPHVSALIEPSPAVTS